MKMNKISAVLAGSALLLVGANAHATSIIQIDDFGGPTTSQSVVGNATNTVAYGGAVGGSRTIDIISSGSGASEAAVIGSIGAYTHSTDGNTTATSLITWDGNGAGLGNLDPLSGLSDGAFSFNIISIQGLAELILTVDSTSFTLSNPGAGAQTINFSGIDFTSVSSISLEIIGGNATDLSLSSLSVVHANVPEPATLALFALGLAGIGYSSRKTKKA